MTRGNFVIINITDCLEGKIEGFTVADLKEALSEFSSIDPNVASFLKKNAQDFARQHKSVTYLVLSSDMTELLGYLTMTIKPITVRSGVMSKTEERAFKKTGRFDEEQNAYTVAAFLIGQLGRNFSASSKNSISGKELLQIALYRLKLIQRGIGGLIVFLEAQGNEKLLSFYGGNGFREFDRRTAFSKNKKPCELVQLFKILK